MADQFNDSIPAVTNQITEDVADISETLGYIKDVFENNVKAWSNTVASGVFIDNISDQSSTPVILQCKILVIGDWDMDADDSKNVAHGLGDDWKKIRSVTGIIRNDSDDTYSAIAATGALALWVASFDVTNIGMSRLSGGAYDNAGYNATSYNRGWLMIWFDAT